MVGLIPQIQTLPFPLTGVWPIAGLWAAIAWSGKSMSVFAAITLIIVGIFQDYLYEAPIGAWPLAFLGAYGVGLIGHQIMRVMSASLSMHVLTTAASLVAALIALAIAGDIAGGAHVVEQTLVANLVATGGLYFLMTPIFRSGGLEAIFE